MYDSYSGPAIMWDENGGEQEIQVSGRIIIDPKSFNQFSPHCSRRWKRMSSKDYDMLLVSRATQAAMRRVKMTVDRGPVINLSSYHHMICKSTVRGYSIKLKRWLQFFVSNITDTSQNTSVFDNVLFSEGWEDLISGFTQARPENAHDLWTASQIEHMSMSIHILGHESTSKGITAEAVSNRINIPLLTIGPDDLGTSLLQTESRLTEVLELVHQWNTLLLLNGSDFLLENCSNYDYRLEDVLNIVIQNLGNHNYKGPFFISTNRNEDVLKALTFLSDSTDNDS